MSGIGLILLLFGVFAVGGPAAAERILSWLPVKPYTRRPDKRIDAGNGPLD